MPVLGVGVYQMNDAKECGTSASKAICPGYGLIDIAAAYQNKGAVGKAIKKAACGGKSLCYYHAAVFQS